jgi:hypothetical protein
MQNAQDRYREALRNLLCLQRILENSSEGEKYLGAGWE